MAGILTREFTLSRRMLVGLVGLALGAAIVAWVLTDPTDEIKKELEAKEKADITALLSDEQKKELLELQENEMAAKKEAAARKELEKKAEDEKK